MLWLFVRAILLTPGAAIFGWVTSAVCDLWLLAFAASGLQGLEPFLR